MNRKPILASLVWLAAAAALLPALKAGATAAPAFTYHRLDPPASANTASTFAMVINPNGLVAGTYFLTGGDFHACVWVKDSQGNYGAAVPLPELPGAVESRALGVDSQGNVVGECQTEDAQSTRHSHATIWQVAGSLPNYQALDFVQLAGGSAQNSLLGAVKLAGATSIIAGSLDSSPFVADSQGHFAPLDVPSSAQIPFADPTSINVHGDVAGTALIGHALLWPHPLTVNGSLSVDITPSGADASATANGINDSGIAVGGYRVDLQHPYHAYVLNGNQESQIASRDDIGVPTGGTTSEAYGINNSGNVVGFSDAGAFYWTPPASPQPASAGAMVNLNTVTTGVPAGDLMDHARAINDAGAIAGFTHHQDNTYAAWVLTPGSGGGGGGTPPAAPTKVHATALSKSHVAITFQDASTTETGFQIQRSTSSKFTPSTVVTTLGSLPAHDGTGATLLWVDNSGLAAHKKYYYRVIATGAGGNATSSVTSATTKTTALSFSVSLKAKVGATATGHLTIVNPLTVAFPLIVPAATAPFAISPSGSVTVQPGGIAPLAVSFHPTVKGKVTVNTTLTLDANANPDPQVSKLFPIPVVLTGTGK